MLAKHSVATLFRIVTTLCWAKNRRCESSRVTSTEQGFTAMVLVIRVYDFKELWREYFAIKSRVTKIVNILIVSMKDFIISFSMSKDLHCRLCVLNNLITYCYYSILYHKKTVFKRYNSATWKSLRQLNQPSLFVSETRLFKFSIGLNFNAVPFFLLIILGFRCSSFLRTFFISNWCIICV